jgi:hypothetical protein
LNINLLNVVACAINYALLLIVFWMGVLSELVLMISVIFTIKKIKNKTREIKDL